MTLCQIEAPNLQLYIGSMAEFLSEMIASDEAMDFIRFLVNNLFFEISFFLSRETPGLFQVAGRSPTSKKRTLYKIFDLLHFRFLSFLKNVFLVVPSPCLH